MLTARYALLMSRLHRRAWRSETNAHHDLYMYVYPLVRKAVEQGLTAMTMKGPIEPDDRARLLTDGYDIYDVGGGQLKVDWSTDEVPEQHALDI